MINMEVYIITPIYNGIEFLEETIQSVVSQTYTNWKMIIGVNGHGETGGGVAVKACALADKYDRKRISVVVQPPPIDNKSKSLNHLITLLPEGTKWVCLLDADDLWLPSKLEKQIEKASQDNVDVIGTFCNYFGEARGSPRLPGGLLPRGSTLHFNPIINSSSMFRKDDAWWSDMKELTGIEDYDMWLRLDYAGRKLYNIPESLTLHRIHKSSAFNSKGFSPRLLIEKYRLMKW